MNTREVYRGFCTVELVQTTEGERTRVVSTDSVNVFIYDKTNDRILLVRQFRAPAIREDNPDGWHTGTVAGRFDVNLSPRALAVKEAYEEAGVTISEDQIELLNGGQPMFLSVGLFTERAYLTYAEVMAEMIDPVEKTFGVVDEGEQIKRIWVPANDLANYPCEDVRVFAMIQWFLRNKRRKV